MRRHAVAFALAGVVVFSAAVAIAAPSGPFGVAPPEATLGTPDGTGLFGQVLALQGLFYRSLTSAGRSLKSDGMAVWTLAGLSFLYGVFHAAGPGHGKAVITAYLLANEKRLRRGVLLSFASALVQGTTAAPAAATPMRPIPRSSGAARAGRLSRRCSPWGFGPARGRSSHWSSRCR